MKQIDTSKITEWNIAKKIKNIKAKPLISIMVDKSVLSKFLVDTIEGKENLGDDAVICLGECNDVWQQMPKTLLKKYSVIEIDKDGWMICEPKPDNSVECFKITSRFVGKDLFIEGQWGEEFWVSPVKVITIQRAVVGDYICRSREDKSDIWIVKRTIFENTYTIIS